MSVRAKEFRRWIDEYSPYSGAKARNPSLYEAAAGGADTPTKALTNHALVAGRRAATGGAGAAAGEAQGSIRIAPLITSPMTTLVQSKYLTHDCSLSLMAATTRNALSMNHAPIITSSVRMDGAENGGLTWVTRWKEPLSRTAVMFRRQDRFRRMPATSICVLWA